MLRLPLLLLALWLAWVAFRLLTRAPRAGGPQQRPFPWPRPPWEGHQNSRRHPEQLSPQEILGVRPGATLAEVNAAYHRLLRQHTPDKLRRMVPELRELAERRLQEIHRSYEVLKRQVRR
ncbi:MAG: J domain-containing protein [Chloroflexi bacterium]|nr:J domain-containing protein [Chloroflexota bacterium]